jgi:homoserine kinase type II
VPSATANSIDLEPIWSQFSEAFRPRSLEFLGNHGGFSGTQLWRADSGIGTLCLRRWPTESPSERQLAFVHDVLLRVHDAGLAFVPPPLRTRRGDTFLRHDGYLWELTPWMPGVADYGERPAPERLRAALHALARFHRTAGNEGPDPVAPSPTMERRFRELRSFLNGPAAAELRRRVPDHRWPEMDERAIRLLRHVEANRSRLATVLAQPLPAVLQQPVIRDIWHDHVLFEGDEVSAIVDFGTMSIDTVVVDVARLLGSLIEYDPSAWKEGLRAYTEVRPLSVSQRSLLAVLDETGIFAGGLVWLRWHYLEYRSFENRSGVLARVDHFLKRLEAGSWSRADWA